MKKVLIGNINQYNQRTVYKGCSHCDVTNTKAVPFQAIHNTTCDFHVIKKMSSHDIHNIATRCV